MANMRKSNKLAIITLALVLVDGAGIYAVHVKLNAPVGQSFAVESATASLARAATDFRATAMQSAKQFAQVEAPASSVSAKVPELASLPDLNVDAATLARTSPEIAPAAPPVMRKRDASSARLATLRPAKRAPRAFSSAFAGGMEMTPASDIIEAPASFSSSMPMPDFSIEPASPSDQMGGGYAVSPAYGVDAPVSGAELDAVSSQPDNTDYAPVTGDAQPAQQDIPVISSPNA
jgi:hypothetical protein